MISFRSIFYIAFAIFLALSHSVSIADGIDLPSSHTTTLVFPTAGNSKITDLSVDIFAALVPEIEASSLQLLSIDNAQSAIELVQKRP
ncbi:MAG: hypothetical protein FWF19_02250, partial [Euryarchaeota archaeon]|nr:hypothetical protein [Euryarchaeota archaeon]